MEVSSLRPRIAALTLLLCAGLSASAACAAPNPAEGCKMAEVGELSLRFIGLRAVVDAEINGQPTALLVDTGADGTLLFHDWGKAYSVAPMLPANRGDKIDVMLSLNGRPVRAEMDSGASSTIITRAAAEAAGAAQPEAPADGRSTGIGKAAVPTYAAVFQSFAFGDERIGNAKLRVADLFAADTVTRLGSRVPIKAIDPPQALLGADFFVAHRVYVARSQEKVYISYVGGPVFDIGPTPSKPAPAPTGEASPASNTQPDQAQPASSPRPSR